MHVISNGCKRYLVSFTFHAMIWSAGHGFDKGVDGNLLASGSYQNIQPRLFEHVTDSRECVAPSPTSFIITANP